MNPCLARRWTHRQSGLSAVRNMAQTVLIVAEAMHTRAAADVARLIDTLVHELRSAWREERRSGLLGRDAPRFDS
jgi:DNA/RNA-binding domain of Phe-tRNA-synthetase-like protein